MLKEQLIKIGEAVRLAVLDDRHYLHAHPELSFQETDTASYIQKHLDILGVPWSPCAPCGTIAILKGDKPSSKVIALRADIDALPIHEDKGIPFKSVVDGKMHACGHDVHTASLLGVIRILKNMTASFGGTIKFFFQPAEEKYPGGAASMVKEGAMANPTPDYMLAQHVMPELSCGKVGFHEGIYSAANDEVSIRIKGRGGHGSQPNMVVDPIAISAQVIVALQQLVSRIANPTYPTVLSFGKIHGDGAFNIIPDEVVMEGTLRTFDPEWRREAHESIKRITNGIVESFGGSCHVDIKGFPNVYNDPMFTQSVRSYAEEFLGKENVVSLPIWMAGEDFGEFTKNTPGCYYRIGVGGDSGENAPLHNSKFNVEEEVFQFSSSLMSFIALRTLEN